MASHPSVRLARRLPLIVAAVVALLFGARRASAATTIPGGNVINQTWTPAGSPYILQGDVTVPNGAKLTIQAGTVVQFASSDGQSSGLDKARVELTVQGSIDVAGTSGSPVTFQAQSGSVPNVYYGIVLDAASTGATIAYATFANATYGITSNATGYTPSITDATFSNSTGGVYVGPGAGSVSIPRATVSGCTYGINVASNAGTVDLTGLVATGNGYGVWQGGSAAVTLAGAILRANTSAGLYVAAPSTGTTTTTVSGSTLAYNGTYGLYVRVATGGTVNLTVIDSIVTNQSNGIYDAYTSGYYGTLNANITYSNVWGNSSYNLYGVSAGTGVIACNPLYVSSSNLTLTSNSPSRKTGSKGQDMGALPFKSDLTPGLYGTLWADTHLTAAGSPYTVGGDLVVPAGVTLTVDPGVTVSFANTDVMQCGSSSSQVELSIAGTLQSNGTAALPIHYTANGAGVSWWGIDLGASATGSSITYTTVDHAVYGLYWEALGDTNVVTDDTFQANSYGIYVASGAPVFKTITASGNGYGLWYANAGAGSVTGSIVASNTNAGIYVTQGGTGSSTLSVTGSTIHANGSYGLYARVTTGGTLNLNVKSSIVTNHSNGIYDAYTTGYYGTLNSSITYSNVWGNSTYDLYGVSAGTGTIACNPLYVGGTNLRLTEYSPSRSTGEAGVDMGALPYTGDATPGLYGTLWSDKHLTAAGSPYAIAGDLVVPSGVKLTIDPGVTLSFASGDIMKCGQSSSQTELVISGTITAAGTQASPILFTSSGTFWGVNMMPSATASTISTATIEKATYGLYWQATGASNAIANDTFQANSYGVYVAGGAPVFDTITAKGNGYGLWYANAGAGSVTGSMVTSNTNAGIYVTQGGTGSSTLAITGSTIHANGSYGLYARVTTGGTLNLNVKNSIVTGQSNGIYDAYTTGYYGTLNASITYSNVWGNSTYDLYGVSAGTGSIACNPLYVGGGNLRITENSPSRKTGEGGVDMGALPYTGDPTPGLYGTLWSDKKLTAAGSPYTVAGDLTVPPGVTLTIDPGVTLSFATSDIMKCGQSVAQGELTVAGALSASGTTASPIKLTSSGTAAGSWWGVTMTAAAAPSTLTHATVERATYGLYWQAATTGHTIAYDTFQSNSYGVYHLAGAPTFDASTFTANGYGVWYGNAPGGALTNDVFVSNTNAGVYITGPSTGTASLAIVNSTLHANGSYGIYARVPSSATLNLDVRNDIVTSHSYGIYYAYTTGYYGTVNATIVNDDVWNNSTYNYYGVSAGAGCISTNPLYVNAPSDLHLQQTPTTSPCIDAGTSTSASTHDRDGGTRPADGDGINGAAFDMGAYEMGAIAACGDGAVNGNEACDDGGLNGTYGHCKTDCSGLGPHCGDGVTNGPEQCDDGNGSNTDACLTTCKNATCGDGFTRAGVEECDDGNGSNTDACLTSCKNATCGDGFVWAGKETCDDGNTDTTDACPACQPATCSDGYVWAGHEECDDGNSIPTDSCTNACTSAKCGDGVVWAGHEDCDDANGSNTDACLNSCKAASCGDGYVWSGVEVCDDGNLVNGDGCEASCKYSCANPASDCGGAPPACDKWACSAGHLCVGVADPTKDGTSCGAGSVCNNGVCAGACGNGVVDSGEQCDFGAGNGPGTGCESNCQFSCTKAPDSCVDANACNGTEACTTVTVNGHTGQKCSPGTKLAKCSACSGGVCDANGACVAAKCGDGCVSGGEQCDDGNQVNGDGCDNGCSYSCSNPSTDCAGTPPACKAWACNGSHACAAVTDPAKNGSSCGTLMVCDAGSCVSSCGNGTVDPGEDCDFGSGNGPGAGCEATCKFSCSKAPDSCADANACNGTESCTSVTVNGHAGQKCAPGTNAAKCVACSGGACDGKGLCAAAFCGDGCVEGTEQCDDGNAVDGDGCDASCKFSCSNPATDCAGAPPACEKWTCSAGHVCTATPDPGKDGTTCGTGSICTGGSCGSSCGNGTVDTGEQCDFGVGNGPGTGCESNCRFSCQTSPVDTCSDGETCNGVEVCSPVVVSGQSGQKCAAGTVAAKCTACSGGVCDGAGVCGAGSCGDGCVEGTEQCDDGNQDDTDACLTSCETASCGDGHVWAGHEECDDGNTDPGDGCSATCGVEGDGGTDGGTADASDGSSDAGDEAELDAEVDASDASTDALEDGGDDALADAQADSDASEADAASDAPIDQSSEAAGEDASGDAGDASDADEGNADLEFAHEEPSCACRAAPSPQSSRAPWMLLALAGLVAARRRADRRRRSPGA